MLNAPGSLQVRTCVAKSPTHWSHIQQCLRGLWRAMEIAPAGIGILLLAPAPRGASTGRAYTCLGDRPGLCQGCARAPGRCLAAARPAAPPPHCGPPQSRISHAVSLRPKPPGTAHPHTHPDSLPQLLPNDLFTLQSRFMGHSKMPGRKHPYAKRPCNGFCLPPLQVLHSLTLCRVFKLFTNQVRKRSHLTGSSGKDSDVLLSDAPTYVPAACSSACTQSTSPSVSPVFSHPGSTGMMGQGAWQGAWQGAQDHLESPAIATADRASAAVAGTDRLLQQLCQVQTQHTGADLHVGV